MSMSAASAAAEVTVIRAEATYRATSTAWDAMFDARWKVIGAARAAGADDGVMAAVMAASATSAAKASTASDAAFAAYMAAVARIL